METEAAKEKYITKKAVQARGWTEKMFSMFLPEPDARAVNLYRQAAPVKLYSEAKVNAMEQTQEFQEYFNRIQESRKKISNARNTYCEKAKLNLIELAKTCKVTVTTQKKVIESACEHYNKMQAEHGVFGNYATPKSDSAFLQRITVNFLRHCCTEYDPLLKAPHGKIGTNYACVVIRNRILMLIGKKHKFLEEETKRQMCQEQLE